MAQTPRQGRNASSMRAHNQHTLLVTLLRQQPISRVRLARETRLSTTTVTSLVAEYLDRGLAQEAGADLEGARVGAGRPRVALRLVPESRCAFGVHIGVRRVRVALVDLQANLVDYESFDISQEQPVERCMARVAEICRGMAKRVSGPYRGSEIVGVGVGASGLVESGKGINLWAPNLGWRDAPLRDLLAQELQRPIVIDNNVRCMALGESLFGIGRAANALAFVYARVGVGAGLVVGGEIYRGADCGAGEIGHWAFLPRDGAACSCGNRGCLETLISERVLLEQTAHIDADLVTGRTNPLQVVFDAARDGHLALVEMLEERAYFVGLALANLVNVLNPQLIMLGGWLYEAFDLIEPVVESTMRRHAFGGTGDQVRVLPTSFGAYCGVVGAAALAFDSFLFTPTATAVGEGARARAGVP